MGLHCILFIHTLSRFSQTPVPTLRDYVFVLCWYQLLTSEQHHNIERKKKSKEITRLLEFSLK